jgi:hypothetical protein
MSRRERGQGASGRNDESLQSTRHLFNFGISEILLFTRPNQFYIPRRPASLEGRFAIVTDVRRDAVDADALLTNGAEADGEVVWS